ncbi:hypothetical protein C3L33_09147, partial [Rhododendron williamsianum]
MGKESDSTRKPAPTSSSWSGSTTSSGPTPDPTASPSSASTTSSSGAPTPPTPPAASPGASACPSSSSPTSPPATTPTPPTSSAPAASTSSSPPPTPPPSPLPPITLNHCIHPHPRPLRLPLLRRLPRPRRPLVALEVEDAAQAYSVSLAHGAKPSAPPISLSSDGAVIAEVQLYGDVVLRYVSFGNPSRDPDGFLPGFEKMEGTASYADLDFGIRRLDHAVGNVHELAPMVEYVKGFTGFHDFAELNSMVLASNDEMHLALASEDIFRTLREMRQRSGVGGFEFMPSPPPTYYQNLKNRAAGVLSDEQIKECEKLGILVDRDDQGTLLQIFTKPVGDRPTLFIEIIQRVGCMLKDDEGKAYQKGGCGGFGKGNFSELFKSIEEYEKTLEAKCIADPAAGAA